MTSVFGHTTHDRYGEEFVAGGCAYYGARVYRQLGDDVHLGTLVGEDFACKEELEGLDRTLVRHGETTLFTNLYPDDGPRLQLLDAWAPMMRPEMFPDDLLADDLVHLAPVLGELDLAEWKEAVDAERLAISVQGWIKAPDPSARRDFADVALPEGSDIVVQKPWDVTVDQLRGVDVACLSDEDLIDQGDLKERLIEAIPVVALTHGAEGASIFVDGAEHRVGIYEEAELFDPTGAGDTFAAAFLHRLQRGDEPVQAGRFAAAAASIVIEHRGGAGIDRLSEASERAESIEWSSP